MEAQTHFLRITAAELLFIITAAIAGALTLTIQSHEWSSIIAVVAFVIALLLRIHLLSNRPERAWYDGRAVAESTKNLAWRYAVGADPFRVDTMTEALADQKFVQRLRDLLGGLKGLHVPPPSGAAEQISPSMRSLRRKPLDERKAVYREERIEDQQEWYSRKARWNKKRARAWSIALLVTEAAGAAAAVLKATGILEVDLLGVAAAIVAACVSWLQTKQHTNLAESYSVAAQELATIKTQILSQNEERTWARFVKDAEEAISREHTLWKASRTR